MVHWSSVETRLVPLREIGQVLAKSRREAVLRNIAKQEIECSSRPAELILGSGDPQLLARNQRWLWEAHVVLLEQVCQLIELTGAVQSQCFEDYLAPALRQ